MASALLFTACCDPQKAAQNSVEKAGKTLAQEQNDLDPQKRLDAYNHVM